MSPLKLALLNLWRRKFASTIMLVAIAVAVGCSGLLLRLYQLSHSRFSTLAHGGDAVVGAKAGNLEILLGALNLEGSYPGFLPQKLFDSLRAGQTVHFEDGVNAQANSIASIIPFLYCGQVGRYRVIGTDQSFMHRPRTEDNPMVAQGEWLRDHGQIVAGFMAARELGLELGAEVTVTPWSQDESAARKLAQNDSFHLQGILQASGSAWDRALFVAVGDAQRLVGQTDLSASSIWRNDVLSYFLIYLKPGGFAALEALVNRRTVGQVISVPQQMQKLEELTGMGQQLGLFMSAFIMALGGLSVAGIMLTRFDAMAAQIAVLRAIGYERRHVAQWLLWEGFLLGMAACVLGAVIDAGLFPLLRWQLGSTLPDYLPSYVWGSWPVWAIAVACTMCAVAWPVWRITHQDVHSSLRGL